MMPKVRRCSISFWYILTSKSFQFSSKCKKKRAFRGPMINVAFYNKNDDFVKA
ncbi:hypothetical cytosolic protein [Syntrophus aciditrophicus SB]|uniref:Hypothetical cytosolic protein n=1 Tax=Syntrophus aciditrophicus (strain SB) TaxID=56780 RepID=Q2LWC6_SYNAS|nr:hypothetical cytosolic protein [Syntrophus aciditrophicus SB]